MRTLFALLLLLLPAFSPAADTPAPLGKLLSKKYAVMSGSETAVVLIYLKDKGPRGLKELHSAAELLSPRSIARRAKVMRRDDVITAGDLPVEASYIAEISRRVVRTRHALKWFNAVSAEATKPQIDALRELPFVREIELVGRWRGTPEPVENDLKGGRAAGTPSGTQAHLLDYGASITQNALSRVPEVHDRGIFGEGVTVGVFDNGFRLLTHESFDSMNIIAQHDFVDHKVSVVPNNPSVSFGSHGVNTLSTIGGYKPGQLIGPAFRADYILARTENDSSETPVEEDNWAAAIEWADSIGVDVTSTSLGYLDYQAPYTSWTWADMDGNTTLITRAADHAVSLGIVVVNSAGNEGPGDGFTNTLIAPADGDSVITAGAVTSAGVQASFSSTGPTTDLPARTKPDVMAMGVSVRVASSTIVNGYGLSSGTSFSCPLSAGIAALILSANPGLDPLQVRDAMRNTADNAATPNNFYGWGILDADSAVRYWGIVPMARLSGTVYRDFNGNGVLDGGESGIGGDTVFLAGPDPDTLVTGGGGTYQFGDLVSGSHSLSVSLAPGEIVTTSPGSLTVSLFHRDTVSGLNIGIFRTGSLSGTVFNDTNENGARDAGEEGLAGWTIRLSGPVTDSTVSDGSGDWSFTGLPGGSYTISQDQHASWLQSHPGGYANHAVTMTDDLDTTGLEFGNFFATTDVFPVTAGWNLLSLPVEMAAPLADSLYPNAISPVSLYANGYYTSDTLPNGSGYWVKFPTPQNILLQGLDRTLDTVEVAAGWNLIGTLSAQVAANSVMQQPDSIIVTPFYSYTPTGYVAVNPDSALVPHRGYWVKCTQPGGLILDAGATAQPGRAIWVGKFYQGGVQCDAETYSPPGTRALLENAGIRVVDVAEDRYGVLLECGGPDYAGVRFALIDNSDLGKAGELGFLPADPPPANTAR